MCRVEMVLFHHPAANAPEYIQIQQINGVVETAIMIVVLTSAMNASFIKST